LVFEKTIISDIESELVKPYRYENPNNIIADAIILKTKYLIAASLDKLFDLSKAINEYKLKEESSIPKNRTIKLSAEIIIRHPIKANINKE
jgi:hypothetical protein